MENEIKFILKATILKINNKNKTDKVNKNTAASTVALIKSHSRRI